MAVRATREGKVGHILLDRPAVLNAVDVAFGAELHDALTGLDADPEITVIVIRGAGGNFSAGGDFAEVQRLSAVGPDALRPLFENFGRACACIAALSVPVVAAVEGYAMAGGFELMLASDIALVRDDAKIADNHANFAQIPGGGSSQRLPRLLGRQRALGLLLSGERLTGRRAAELGLAYRSFPADEFDAGVTEFVSRLAGKSRVALAGIKRLVHDGLGLPLADGLAMERQRVVEHICAGGGQAGVDAFNRRGA